MNQVRVVPLLDASFDDEAIRAAVRTWVDANVPESWRAAASGGASAIRRVRSRADYESWYPTFAASGLVAPALPVAYGGLGIEPRQARIVEEELRVLNLGRLNVLGLNLMIPTLLAFGSEAQRLRFIPPAVRNQEIWCQLFSEPGAGSDLASLATTAVREGDCWVVTGQKVWSTWAHRADWGVLLCRTDADAPKRDGLTYLLCPMRSGGVSVRPLRHIGGEVDFNEVFLDEVRVPLSLQVGGEGDGWRVANATLGGERAMVSGAGAGGVDRIGGSGVSRLIGLARETGRWQDPSIRQRLMAAWSEERIRGWTNARARESSRAGRPPGPETSIGKIHQTELNQRVQLLAVDICGPSAVAWESSAADYAESLPYEVSGMLRSRANTIEGGTSEVNRNIVGERVLGLPREPDPWRGVAWREVPRS